MASRGSRESPGYTDIDDPNLPKTLFRKEYASLRTNAENLKKIKNTKKKIDVENPSFLDELIRQSGKLQLSKYQQFPANWINPSTPHERLLLKFDTGTGKTVTVINAALGFARWYVDAYRVWETDSTPNIFIIGFARNVFIRELMRRPEFGFITRAEIAHEARLRVAANNGSQLEKDELTRFHTEIKKRFSKKSIGGFFRFYGYKEFFNRLFIFTVDGLIRLSKFLQVDQLDRSSLTEDQILIGLREGLIRINFDLVDSLGFMACDEFHNAYNALSINNYGIAIRIALMIHDRPDLMDEYVHLGRERLERLKSSSSVRAIFMTATPLNNSPTEIIDLLNVLVKLGRIQEFYGDRSKIRLDKADFFDGRSLKPNALASIGKLVQGCVSYLSDTNPAFYPTSGFVGESIPIPASLASMRLPSYHGKTIPYLKFVRCPMSPLHLRTYKAVFQGTLPPDGQNLMDIVLPNPDPESQVGLFKTRDIKQILKTADSKWKERHRIDVQRQTIGSTVQTDVIVGDFMLLPELKDYSTKYAEMIKDVIHNLQTDGGKMVINHQTVRGSGVLMIDEILKLNGIIEENSEPMPTTRCSRCGQTMKSHAKVKDHSFVPARFILLHSDIDISSRERSLEKFKHVNNIMGYLYRICLGSQIINESVDLSEVREINIMTVPDDISTLIQIIGRAIRKASHNRLPPELRHVAIRVYTSSLEPGAKDLSYEERRYLEKSMDYLIIQDIDRVLNSNAIDAPLNYNIIFGPDTKTKTKEPAGSLAHLPYTIDRNLDPWRTQKALTPNQIQSTTWNIFHSSDEPALITYIIKRLFIEQSHVFTYEDLWQSVREPPFEVHFDTNLLSEEAFAMSLDDLVDASSFSPGSFGSGSGSTDMVDSLFNPQCRTIQSQHRIVQRANYYMLVPLATIAPMEVAGLGYNVMELLGVPDVDYESWHRHEQSIARTTLNITKQLQTTSASYEQLKMRFYKAYKDAPISDFPSSLEVYGMDFHVLLVQDAIKYCFNILTNPDMLFSELHSFYFKVLYFYDKFDMILYCSDIVGTSLFDEYKKYVTRADITYGLHGARKKGEKLTEADLEHHNAFLMSSMRKSAGLSKPFDLTRLNDFLGRTKSGKSLSSRPHAMRTIVDDAWIPKPARITKVFSNLLPIGHFVSIAKSYTSHPIVYNPEAIFQKPKDRVRNEWSSVPDFSDMLDSENPVENDMIIGYYDQGASIELKFKLRSPVALMVKHVDTRMQERGSACNTRKKEELLQLANDLGLKSSADDSIKAICDAIKIELMRREIVERKRAKKTRKPPIRWFYFHFEKQPTFGSL